MIKIINEDNNLEQNNNTEEYQNLVQDLYEKVKTSEFLDVLDFSYYIDDFGDEFLEDNNGYNFHEDDEVDFFKYVFDRVKDQFEDNILDLYDKLVNLIGERKATNEFFDIFEEIAYEKPDQGRVLNELREYLRETQDDIDEFREGQEEIERDYYRSLL